jgi:hypothetical protein
MKTISIPLRELIIKDKDSGEAFTIRTLLRLKTSRGKSAGAKREASSIISKMNMKRFVSTRMQPEIALVRGDHPIVYQSKQGAYDTPCNT